MPSACCSGTTIPWCLNNTSAVLTFVGELATFDCLMKTYGFLTPDFWRETRFTKSPFQEYTDLLAKPTKAIVLEDAERVEA